MKSSSLPYWSLSVLRIIIQNLLLDWVKIIVSGINDIPSVDIDENNQSNL
ncbi:hypothetical protein LNO75_00455 [Mycoplasma sp. T363T]|nr:hypothetical protein [Mycoplasma bradburyae]MDC4163052.1 hypothetical protein [Mycoplasma bradburyae]MDC4183820.1 hypothetical protein [Mycoplasma bradburyae]